MSPRHVVVDGSNIATEGRSLPSLAQLDEAVQEFRREHPDDVITVVVDATFGHRIDESEVELFKEAEAHNEVVSPPAGAIGRGDAFLLRIAERVGATVLSNDSFQEFHGEHEWLFEKGRLIGGKPVPGVGWIFTPRTPVRGPKSREAVKVAKRSKKADSTEFGSLEEEVAARRAAGRRPPKKTAAEKAAAAKAAAGKAAAKPAKVEKAIAMATEEAVEPDAAGAGRRRRRRSAGGAPPSEPVNAPLLFINFVSDHPLGSEVEGEVEQFSSHGAFVMVGEARCYIPLSAMGEPAPRAARDVLKRSEKRQFVIQAFDPPRRGIELALPGFAHVAAAPTQETVEDEIAAGSVVEPARAPAPAKRTRKKKAAEPVVEAVEPAPVKKAAVKKTSAKKAPATKTAAKKKATAKKAEPAKKAAAKKPAGSTKKAAAAPKKAAAKKTPVKKAAAAPKKAAAKKTAAAAKKTPAKKAPAAKKKSPRPPAEL